MNILLELRTKAKLSLRALGELADVDPKTINRLENDKQKAQRITLQSLAEALNSVLEPKGRPVTVEDLEPLLDTGYAERSRKSKRISEQSIIGN